MACDILYKKTILHSTSLGISAYLQFDMTNVMMEHRSDSISGTIDTHTGFIANTLLSRIAPAHLNAMILIDVISFIMFEIKLKIVITPIQKENGNSLIDEILILMK